MRFSDLFNFVDSSLIRGDNPSHKVTTFGEGGPGSESGCREDTSVRTRALRRAWLPGSLLVPREALLTAYCRRPAAQASEIALLRAVRKPGKKQ